MCMAMATHTTMNTALKMDTKPTQVGHPRVWNLRMLATLETTMVARNDHQTLHTAWFERALIAIETPRIPPPVQRIQLGAHITVRRSST